MHYHRFGGSGTDYTTNGLETRLDTSPHLSLVTTTKFGRNSARIPLESRGFEVRGSPK
jgi:hypothetical protein